MPLGFEWGFRKRVDVVKTMPDDWEETNVDISDYIKKVNKIKKSFAVFKQESAMQIVTDPEDVFFAMLKIPSGVKGGHALVVINKDLANRQSCSLEGVKWFAGGRQIKTQVFPVKASLDKYSKDYEPGEVRVFVNK